MKNFSREAVTQAIIKELLDYSIETGIFTWKKGRTFTARTGVRAGHISKKGYRRIKIDGRQYFEHRLVWLFVFGVWPTAQIDHVNGNKDDNRISNLRAASAQQNGRNKSQQKDSSSPHKGVSFQKDRNAWQAHIRTDSGRIFLGRFKTSDEAFAAYCEAAKTYHREFANTGAKS